MGYWEYDYDYDSKRNFDDDFAHYDNKKTCRHKWKAILLIYTTVYDCELCGAKKEEVEG